MPTPDAQVDQKERWQSEGLEDISSLGAIPVSAPSPSIPGVCSGLSLLLGISGKGWDSAFMGSPLYSTKDLLPENTHCLFKNDILPCGSF